MLKRKTHLYGQVVRFMLETMCDMEQESWPHHFHSLALHSLRLAPRSKAQVFPFRAPRSKVILDMVVRREVSPMAIPALVRYLSYASPCRSTRWHLTGYDYSRTDTVETQ